MVGFGSSLRQARRPGWEDAYLDYETLKLLLSQMEAVYEEEGHRKQVDYQQELFQEDDSLRAYDDENDEDNEGFGHDEASQGRDDNEQDRQAPLFGSLFTKNSPSPRHKDRKVGDAAVSSQQYLPSDDDDEEAHSFPYQPNPGTFLMPSGEQPNYSSMFQMHPTSTDERTSLLPTASNDVFYSFHHRSGSSSSPDKLDRKTFVSSSNLHEHRQRERRGRRKPPMARAHRKARAITERFLGLLRAETEKVMLFAQARLGDLADTAGSLRFSSMVDERQLQDRDLSQGAWVTSNAQGVPHFSLSDGGLHRSSSSSDDDGPSGGPMPWSDSSSDEEDGQNAEGALPPTAVSSASSGNIFRTTPQQSKRKAAAEGPGGVIEKTLTEEAERVRAQLLHFEEIRQRRPIFQRNDYILGEDMLLISAVEEADSYTSVAVELIHVLRYICVNLVAVRKICRKHDRLLMNRMLGGYYLKTKDHERYLHIEDAHTLGGLVARVSGDIYEAHPALIGHMTYYKLVGVYDKKIQKLANSRTVQVISSCLALALSEYEIAESRADALTKFNASPTTHLKQYDEVKLEPATQKSDSVSAESTMSLTRLRFAVTSIFALREATRYKLDHFNTYVARSLLSFTGQGPAGEGFDGSSKETLDFIVGYNPDCVLLLDSNVLYNALQRGMWNEVPLSDVMVSTLATSTSFKIMPRSAAAELLTLEETAVHRAVSIRPGPNNPFLRRLFRGRLTPKESTQRSRSVSFLSSDSLRLNRVACFLYTMNYFMAHSTATSFAIASNRDAAYTAFIIGIANVGSVIMSAIICHLLSRDIARRNSSAFNVSLIRNIFLASSVMGVVGNILHGVAVNQTSVPLALIGRFLIGFSSLEVLHRLIISTCLPPYLINEAAYLVESRFAGLIMGLFAGFLVETLPLSFSTVGIRVTQAASWLMAALWLIQFIRVILYFGGRVPVVPIDSSDATKESSQMDGDISLSESSESDYGADTPSKIMMYRTDSDATPLEPFKDAIYGATIGAPSADPVPSPPWPSADERRQRPRRSRIKVAKTAFRRLRKLLAYRIGIPICFLALFYTSYAFEAFFTSAPIATFRYFSWDGAHAGVFLGCLTMLFIPTTYFCEIITRRFEERSVMKRSIVLLLVGLLFMINWESLFSLARQAPQLWNPMDNTAVSHPYDWHFGFVQYTVGLTVVVVGIVAMEGSALSLLSKLSPSAHIMATNIVMNIGTVTFFISCAARILADVQVFCLTLSDRLIDSDLVNSLVIPLLIGALIVRYVVKRDFFFLM